MLTTTFYHKIHSLYRPRNGDCAFDNKRFLLNDGIHTLAYGHKGITTKVETKWEGPELFILSADEVKRNGLHLSHPIDPNMMQPRAPKKSVWQARRKIALDKAKTQILEGMTGEIQAALNEVSEESSDEEAKTKHKKPLSSQTTTSASLDMKPKYPPTIASSSYPPISPMLTDIKPGQSSATLLSPLMSPPTCAIDPFDSDTETVSSDDSIF